MRGAQVKRPLPHHILIASYIITPLVNLLLVAFFLRLPLPGAAERILAGYGPLVAVWLATAPVAGAFLYLLDRVSWYVFLVHASIIVAGSVVTLGFHLLGNSSVIPREPRVLFLAGNVLRMGFVGYVVQKDFRSPYLQVLARSFRSGRRLLINRPILVDGEIYWISDLSTGGCFIALPGTQSRLGRRLHMRLDWGGAELECDGEVMRRTSSGLGVRFVDLSRHDRRALRRMLAPGKAASVADRVPPRAI